MKRNEFGLKKFNISLRRIRRRENNAGTVSTSVQKYEYRNRAPEAPKTKHLNKLNFMMSASERL